MSLSPRAMTVPSTAPSVRPKAERSRLGVVGSFIKRAALALLGVFPLTGLGLLVTAAAAWALQTFVFGKLDLVLLVVCYATLLVVAIAVCLVVLTAIGTALALRKSGEPTGEQLNINTLRPTKTGASMRALPWLPLVRRKTRLVEPTFLSSTEASKAGRIWEVLTVSRRSEIDGAVRRYEIEDPFGLARISFRRQVPLRAFVMPHVGALERMPLLNSLSGGDDIPHPMGLADGDRVDLRRYAPGDPARFIHWKAFSRTRKLIVRMPERALSRAKRTIAYLVAGPEDEASAAAAWVAIRSSSLGDEWTFGADGVGGTTSDVKSAQQMIVQSADAFDTGGKGLGAFLVEAEKRGPASALLFVPAKPGPWIDHVLGAATRGRRGMRAVIGVDGIEETQERSFFARLTTHSVDDEGTLANLRLVSNALQSANIEVIIVDRLSGRVLSDGHLRAVKAKQAPRVKMDKAS